MVGSTSPKTPGSTIIAVIGLGIMGKPMAKNLLTAGYSLRVHSRRKPPVDEMAALGAFPASTPAEAAREADVVITVLPDSPDVKKVVMGPEGINETIRAGATFIDMSTISPIVSRELASELAQKGIHVLDAPVSGGEKGAIEAALSIMVGGEQGVFEACMPIFESLGKNIVYLGPSGAGQVTKACNQIIVAVTIQAISEALTLASKAGVDPVKVRQALLGGFAGSRILEMHGQRILDHNFKPGFKVKLHHKDLGIALSTGKAMGVPLVTTALVDQLLSSLEASGKGDLDHSALALLVEQLCNM